MVLLPDYGRDHVFNSRLWIFLNFKMNIVKFKQQLSPDIAGLDQQE